MLKRTALWFVLLPFQLSLIGLFLVVELIHQAALLLAPTTSPEPTPKSPAPLCSIVVLNWNGRHLLEESLPALKQAVHHSRREHEILVVDNGSSDDSLEWLQQHHSDIRVLPLESNLGFGEGNNRGVKAARHDIVVLLNNDMIVSEEFLPPLLEPFSDPQVFAVSSQIFLPEGKPREETGNTQAYFRWGRFHLAHEAVRPVHSKRKHLPVLWAGGGSSAFDRHRFLELGGFSPIFSPCYCEDTDLSYRAWRRGWKVLLAAESQVLHKHRSSSSKLFSESALQQMLEQRKLWYLWKNFQLGTLLPHFLLLPAHLGAPGSLSIYRASLTKLPAILRSRMKEPRRRVPERMLFRWIRRPLTYLDHYFADRHHEKDPRLSILVVSAYLPQLGHHGGAGRVLQLLSRASEHHRLTTISFVEDGEDTERTTLRDYCRRIELVPRREHQPVSFFPYEPFEEFNTKDFRARLERLLEEEDFDLVHFEWTQMAQYADLFPHTPKLLTEIEVNYAAHYSQVRVEHDPIRKIRKFYNSLQTFYRELELCRKADQIVCVTDHDRDYLRGYIQNKRISVINTGVDTNYFSPHPDGVPEPHSLVYVGAFRHEPNVDAMLYFYHQIFPLILKECPSALLYIVGSHPPPSIRNLDRHPQVIVTGYVEDIRAYYQQAQVVVVPLRTGVGIRGKILEGWAAGKAMVASSVACLGIRALHGQNILVADDPKEFALWTLALLRQPRFCRQLGDRGRQTAVRFYDWSLMGRQMAELYQEVSSRYRNVATR